MNVAQLIVFQTTVRDFAIGSYSYDMQNCHFQEQVYLISFICT